jgi:NADPH:quinone reductase-like Zn-dependent oxidoreductase
MLKAIWCRRSRMSTRGLPASRTTAHPGAPKPFGAEVTGVCSAAKVDTVRGIGADHVIDYTREDFTDSGPQYDLILDMGGNRSLSQLRRALTPGGTLVLVGGEGGDRWIGIGRPVGALLVSPFVSHRLRPLSSKPNKPDLQFLKELIEAGKVTPVIDRTYALSETAHAMRYLEKGHARGRVVITHTSSRTAAPEG